MKEDRFKETEIQKTDIERQEKRAMNTEAQKHEDRVMERLRFGEGKKTRKDKEERMVK